MIQQQGGVRRDCQVSRGHIHEGLGSSGFEKQSGDEQGEGEGQGGGEVQVALCDSLGLGARASEERAALQMIQGLSESG